MRHLRTSIKSTLMIHSLEPSEETHLKNIFFENGLFLDIVSLDSDFMARLEQQKFDCVIINSDIENNQPQEIIDNIKIVYPWIIVIILLKNPSFEKIFQLVRYGVDDFIIHPFLWEDVEKVLSYYYY